MKMLTEYVLIPKLFLKYLEHKKIVFDGKSYFIQV